MNLLNMLRLRWLKFKMWYIDLAIWAHRNPANYKALGNEISNKQIMFLLNKKGKLEIEIDKLEMM